MTVKELIVVASIESTYPKMKVCFTVWTFFSLTQNKFVDSGTFLDTSLAMQT